MANTQTIAQLPYNVTDTDSLKRFLRELVDNLDEVLGYKGDQKYVKSSDFQQQGTSLNELTDTTKSNTEALDKAEKTVGEHSDELLDIQNQIDKLNTILKTIQLDTVYRDFNNSAWNDLQGRAELSALGSELSNTPEPLVAASTYTVYIDSTKTNSSVWQTVLITDGTDIDIFSRVGVNSAWVKLNN